MRSFHRFPDQVWVHSFNRCSRLDKSCLKDQDLVFLGPRAAVLRDRSGQNQITSRLKIHQAWPGWSWRSCVRCTRKSIEIPGPCWRWAMLMYDNPCFWFYKLPNRTKPGLRVKAVGQPDVSQSKTTFQNGYRYCFWSRNDTTFRWLGTWILTIIRSLKNFTMESKNHLLTGIGCHLSYCDGQQMACPRYPLTRLAGVQISRQIKQGV